MKMILVATDLSERSDRAARRATLLARRFGACILLLHVVDGDRPQRLIRAERETAAELLAEQARTLTEVDGVETRSRVIVGDVFDAIAGAAEDEDADLVVLGPHCRRAFLDAFLGSTAERTARAFRRPGLMALALPGGPYRRILLATDFSAGSVAAAEAIAGLGLRQDAAVSTVAVASPEHGGLLAGASLADSPGARPLEEERTAAEALSAFVAKLSYQPLSRSVRHEKRSVAADVCDEAQEMAADLIVVGTHSRSGVERLFLGSCAAGILLTSDRDVLAVPPQAARA